MLPRPDPPAWFSARSGGRGWSPREELPCLASIYGPLQYGRNAKVKNRKVSWVSQIATSCTSPNGRCFAVVPLMRPLMANKSVVVQQRSNPQPCGFVHDSAPGRYFRFYRSGLSRSSDLRFSRAKENQGQETNFALVGGGISLPYHPIRIVPEKRPFRIRRRWILHNC